MHHIYIYVYIYITDGTAPSMIIRFLVEDRTFLNTKTVIDPFLRE